MSSRRTRRDVLRTTAGLGLTGAAGCLDESGAPANGTETENGDENGTENGGDDGPGNGADAAAGIAGPTYREFAPVASASIDGDHSVHSFEAFDLAALDAVADSLPGATEAQLRREAHDVLPSARDQHGEANIDGTFSFELFSTYANAVVASCRGLEGSFDVDSLRDQVDLDDESLEYRQVAGFDLYTQTSTRWPISSAVSSDRILHVTEGPTGDDVASMLETVASGGLEPGDELDDFATLTDRLDDGVFVGGEVRPYPRGEEIGHGVSVAINDEVATTRMAELYEEEPGPPSIDDFERRIAVDDWSEVYDDVSTDAEGRTTVVTATVGTDRFEPLNY